MEKIEDDWTRMADRTWKTFFFKWAKQVWLQSPLMGPQFLRPRHSSVCKNDIKVSFYLLINYFRKDTK